MFYLIFLGHSVCVCVYVCFENLTSQKSLDTLFIKTYFKNKKKKKKENLTSAILLFEVNSLDFTLVTSSPTLLWGNLLYLIGWNHY